MHGGTGGIGNIEIIGCIEKPGVSGISMRVAEFEQRRGGGARNCESDLFGAMFRSRGGRWGINGDAGGEWMR